MDSHTGWRRERGLEGWKDSEKEGYIIATFCPTVKCSLDKLLKCHKKLNKSLPFFNGWVKVMALHGLKKEFSSKIVRNMRQIVKRQQHEMSYPISNIVHVLLNYGIYF